MTTLAPLPVQSFRDSNGNPLAGGLLYTYSAGTSTPLATYTDSTGVTPNANPIVLNSRGEANIWLGGGLTYKFLLNDSLGVLVWTVDQISAGGSSGNPIALASAATVDIGGQGSSAVEISGTTAITSFGTNYNGPRFLRFTGALVLTQSASLNLPGGANITTAAGDTAIAYPNLAATGWNIVGFQRGAGFSAASGPLATSGITGAAASGANNDIFSLGALTAQTGFRNLLMNAIAAINQRAYVSGTATVAANQYTLDRWRVITSGQSLAFTASGNGNAMTAPAGGLEQVIEGANIGITAGVINWVGTATCTVDGVAKTKAQTVTLVPGTNCSVKFFSGTVSLPQIEPGPVPTPFEFRPLTLEIALCKRYYRVQQWFWQGSSAGLGQGQGWTWTFETPMRVVPTIVFFNQVSGATPGTTAPQTVDGCGMYSSGNANGAVVVSASANAEI